MFKAIIAFSIITVIGTSITTKITEKKTAVCETQRSRYEVALGQDAKSVIDECK
jgi:hypothetical protein